MRVLICGGRDFDDWGLFTQAMIDVSNKEGGPITTIISGGARGADTFAQRLAKGWKIDFEKYPADWEQYGRAAGHIRNQQMLDEGKPDLVIAFPGGRGTANMIERAKKAGVKVIQYSQEEDPSSTSPQS